MYLGTSTAKGSKYPLRLGELPISDSTMLSMLCSKSAARYGEKREWEH
jgi:hypothetical protein